jgi:hypothetical protein
LTEEPSSPASHTRSHDVESPSAARARSEESEVQSEREPPSTTSRATRRSSCAIGGPASHTRSHRRGSPASHTRLHDRGSPGVKAESSSQQIGRPAKKRGPGPPRKKPEANAAPVKKRVPPRTGKGLPPKKPKTKVEEKEEDATSVASMATRSSARLPAKPAPVASSASTSRKSARPRRSTREESHDSDDEVDSQASTKSLDRRHERESVSHRMNRGTAAKALARCRRN